MRQRDQGTPFTAGLWLALIGLAGLAGAVTLGLVALFGFRSVIGVAIALYVGGFVAMVVVTAGATLSRPLLWGLRLIAPLIGPLLVFAVQMSF